MTYLPQTDNVITLTTNRDESPKREPADFPVKAKTPFHQIVYPQDGEKGGTWIAAASSGKVINLMNGGFVPHQSNPPYRKSRGLVLLDAFDYHDFETFSHQANFDGIEPFTMVFIEPLQIGTMLSELRWDGFNRYYQTLNPDKPHLWASASLYSHEAHNRRNQYFHQSLNDQSSSTPLALIHLHHQMAMGCFERDYMEDGSLPPVETQSITQVSIEKNFGMIQYKDLKQNYTIDQKLFPAE